MNDGMARNGRRHPPINPRAAHAVAERVADRREAKQLVQMLGAPATPREKVHASIERVAGDLQWEVTRVADIWRGHARRIDAWELDALRYEVRKMFRVAEKI
jgi:hypothetical protein